MLHYVLSSDNSAVRRRGTRTSPVFRPCNKKRAQRKQEVAMFCYNCRQELAEGTAVCPACGAAQNQGAAGPAVGAGAAAPVIPNHLVGAILATLFCCLPFGIVAIVYASGVNGKIAAGDIAGAEAASKKAATWINAPVICGIIAIILNVILQVTAASSR